VIIIQNFYKNNLKYLAASETNSESIAEQSTSSRRLSAYNKLVHAALRRRHLR